MLRRPRQINAEPGRLAERLRSAADVVRWPLERAAWAVEERVVWPAQEKVVWPLRERVAGFGAPPRASMPATANRTAVLALAALAVVAVAVVLLAGRGGDEEALPGAEPVVSYAPAPAPVPDEEKPAGPVLHGVTPDFDVERGVGVAGPDASDSSDGAGGEAVDGTASADTNSAATDDATTDDAEAEAGATASSRKAVPAGPAAMKVARRFSQAFVFYEIGQRPARAMTVFQETASPQLATALAERPPRQPQGTEVPKARVLNLVPGPRQGKAYTVSASLLRVGTVSELRLKLARQAGAWVVTDVRG
jgi:hypothetical protein